MVEVSDIMLGNYIILKEVKIDEYITQDPKIVKVDSLYFDILSPDIYLINGYTVGFYDPIMITEDWLTKFNFNYYQKFDEWYENPDQSGFYISRNYENGYWSCGSVDIQYVHELQNIFRMKRKLDLFID